MPRGEGKGLGAGVGARGPEQGGVLKARPRDSLGGCEFLCPTQQASFPVIEGMNWDELEHQTLQDLCPKHWWLCWHMDACPRCQGKGTAPRCSCVKHRGGLAAPSVAPAPPSPPAASAIGPTPALLLLLLLGCAPFPRGCPQLKDPTTRPLPAPSPTLCAERISSLLHTP